MKFDMNFTVTAICNKFKNGEDEIQEKAIFIDLTIDKSVAANFLFRFAPTVFNCGDYKVLLKFNDMNCIMGIALLKEDDVFIVTNMNQLLSQILEGFVRTRTTEKLVSIMEFDFETALENSEGIVDEFDLNK